MSDDPTVVPVATSSPYDVVVGFDLAERLPGLLGADVRRVALIHPLDLAGAVAAYRRTLEDAGYRVHLLTVPTGEAAKSAGVASSCWAALGRAGLTRSDAVVGFGGGATTDLAGFVAATWMRGVAVVHVPTTLLGMVDAAVGGKTAINTAEGKNLVGAIHEPLGVLCDLRALATLPRAELVSGMAEVVKCGFVADPGVLDLIEAGPEAALDPAGAVLRELVVRAVAVKAQVVSADLRETAAATGGSLGREVLNYGHTFGHAVERVERYTYRHGAAVAIGMCYVAELAHLAGCLDADTSERHRRVLRLLGLPTTYRPGLWDSLHEAMRVDKKARGDALRFVVLYGLARPGELRAPEPALLTAAYATIARDDPAHAS